MNKIKNAFDDITATAELKKSAYAFAHKQLNNKAKKNYSAKLVLAFCSLLIVVAAIGAVLYSSPVTTISIDVNPSIELQLNVFNRVVSATAYNDDGNLIMKNVTVNNLEYTEAIDKILNDSTFQRYIMEDSLLVITVASDKKEEIIGGIESTPQFADLSTAQVQTEVVEGNDDIIEEAHSCGLSFGKYQAFAELQKLDSTITSEDAVGMTMREIRNRILKLTGDAEPNSEGNSASQSESQCEENSDCISGQGGGNGSEQGEHKGNGNGEKGKGYKGGKGQ